MSMTEDPTGKPSDRRKLVAVLYMDMVGYSRLIGLDDVGTLRRLRTLRREVIDPVIEEHGGRLVNTGGDSLLLGSCQPAQARRNRRAARVARASQTDRWRNCSIAGTGRWPPRTRTRWSRTTPRMRPCCRRSRTAHSSVRRRSGATSSISWRSRRRAPIDRRIVHIGCNIAYDVGLYTFELDGDQPGTRTKVGARYTFIYAAEGGKWLIVHHHSSALPESPKS
jgi:hypothetical protein